MRESVSDMMENCFYATLRSAGGEAANAVIHSAGDGLCRSNATLVPPRMHASVRVYP